MTQHVGIPADQIGGHANIVETSELLFVNPKQVRRDRLAGGDSQNNGVSGNNQGKSTPEIGKALLQIKIDNALAQIEALMAGTTTRQQSEAPAKSGRPRRTRWQSRRRTGGRDDADRRTSPATMLTAPAGKTPTAAPDTVFIDELTWEEMRDAIKAGKTAVIVPTGGTEQNGSHMGSGSTTTSSPTPRT